MSGFSLTEEQKYIIQTVVDEKKNLVIAAMAGSGKTTTLLQVAKKFSDKYLCQVLILTYNNQLRHECCDRIQKSQLQNQVECHTYHSATLRFFLEKEGRRDFHESLIHDALKTEHTKKNSGIEKIRLFLLDECQDQTDSLAKLVIHLLQENLYEQKSDQNDKIIEKPVLVMCGDGFQKIYGFNHTTLEYMMFPEKHFGALVANQGKFHTARLSICFRTTHEIASWINEHMHPKHLGAVLSKEKWDPVCETLLTWWGDGIHADPSKGKGEPVTYIKTDWNFQQLATQLTSIYEKYSVEDVTILCLSGKSEKAPVWRLLNALTEVAKPKQVNWACFFKDSGEEQAVIKGKRVASTIHRWKGLENKVTIAFGVDGYAEKKTQDLLELFNVYYVGLTRASVKLVVIQCDSRAFATIRICQELKNDISGGNEQIVYRKNKVVKTLNPQQVIRKIAARYSSFGLELAHIFSFVPYDTYLDQEALKITANFQLPASEVKTLHPDMYLIQCVDPLTKENVIPLYGLALEFAIQLWFQKKKKCIPSYEEMYNVNIGEEKRKELKEVISFIAQYENFPCKQVDPEMEDNYLFDWSYLVKMANAYRCLSCGLLCKWRQLQKFDEWVPKEYLKEMFESSVALLQAALPGVEEIQVKFHQHLKLPIYLSHSKVNVLGHVFMETKDATIHLSFQQSGVSETQSCVAFGTTSLYQLNQKPRKKTYILSPQQGVVFRVQGHNEESVVFHENFLLQSIARKFNVPRALFSLAVAAVTTKKKRKSITTTTSQSKNKKRKSSTRKIASYFPPKKSTQTCISEDSPFYKFFCSDNKQQIKIVAS